MPTQKALVAALDSNGTPGIQQDEQDTADDAYTQALSDYRNIGWAQGIAKSFNDAPDGFSEELKEKIQQSLIFQSKLESQLHYFELVHEIV